jgi:hypothetical protein
VVVVTAELVRTVLAAAIVLVAVLFLVSRLRRTFARRSGCGCASEGTPGCSATSSIDRIRRAARKAAARTAHRG